MLNINKVQLYGNLTRDPETKALPSGQAVTNFSVATNRNFKDKDGQKQEQVEFHNLVAFGRTAEVIAQYLKRGRPIYVDGRLQTRSWDKDGSKMYRTEIIVENFQFGPTQHENSQPAEKFDKTPDPDKTYRSSLEDVVEYPERPDSEDVVF